MRLRAATLAALLALSMGTSDVEAQSCALSGLSPAPQNTTLAVGKDDASVGVVVAAACAKETAIAIDATIPSETVLKAAAMDIVHVVSYPKVDKLNLATNAIEAFTAMPGSDLVEVHWDLSNNAIASLDAFQFPASLERLDLSDNRLKTTRADQFPSGLKNLYLAKNGIESLETFDFPATLTLLQLNGNGLTTLNGALFPDTLESLECQTCKITTIEGVRFPSKLKTMLLSGATVTSFVVRASDVTTLTKASQVSLVTTVTNDCESGGTYTTIKTGLAACVMSDDDFEAKYPQRAALIKPTSKPGSSTTTAPSATSGTTAAGGTAAPSPSSDTNSSSSSSSMYLVVGLIMGGAVLIGAIIALVVQRRKREPLRRSDLRELLAEAAAAGRSAGKNTRTRTTTAGGEATGPPLTSHSSSAGYFTNDVRNDEELLPYRLPKDEVKIISELAIGGFGIVYLAKFFDQVVVVKRIVPTKMHSNVMLKRFMDEIRLYARLEHPKITRFIGLSWTTLFDLSLVMEYLPNGDLSTLLKNNRALPDGREVFTWFSEDAQPRSKTLIALDLVEALVYLHSFDPVIIHRDLKSKNVLMGEDWTAKLGDFGISRVASEETMTGGMGTTAWIAPEVLQGERYSEKADIYSFGIVMSELDTCGHPYNSNRAEDDSLTDPKIAVLVSTDRLKPTIEADCPSAIRDVILSCVEFDPAKRPNAMDLHFRLRSIRNNALAGGFA